MSNVVILISDEHNPKYASPYGHPMVRTPNMARLAQTGTLFENAYCPSPLCMPSRSALMAGRWVHEIQTYSNCNCCMETFDYPTYGAVLAEQGVHTVHIGKTDVYRPGTELGFSEMILPGDRDLPGDTNHGRTPLSIRADGAARANRYGPSDTPWGPDLAYIERAVEWLRTVAPTLNAPWVLSVNIHKPHFPHWVTQELWDMYPNGGDLPVHGPECASANHPYALDLRKHFQTDQFVEEHIRGLRRGYLGCITFVDRQLGRLMETIEGAGLSENTNVIYSTDHGEMLGKFGMWWKCSLYDDSLRVPLIAAGPDFAAGQRVTTPVSTMDMQASCFVCTKTERPEGWAGEPLQDIAPDDPERIVFAEYHGHGTRSGAYMVRQGRWKYLRYAAAPAQLFDMVADPEELDNLAERMPEHVAALDAALCNICDPEGEAARAHAFEQAQLDAIAAANV